MLRGDYQGLNPDIRYGDSEHQTRSSLLSIVSPIVFQLCRPEFPVVETVQIHSSYAGCLTLRSLCNSFQLSLNPSWAHCPIHSLFSVFSGAISLPKRIKSILLRTAQLDNDSLLIDLQRLQMLPLQCYLASAKMANNF